MNSTDVATKKDVGEIVGRVVGEIARDIMQLVSDRFDDSDKRIERLETETKQGFAQLSKLKQVSDDTVDRVAHHEIDIRTLKRKTALA